MPKATPRLPRVRSIAAPTRPYVHPVQPNSSSYAGKPPLPADPGAPIQPGRVDRATRLVQSILRGRDYF